ncbi:MAG: hypothetical protein J6U42_05590 [Lachnospiraceae bacterium]|nr:hypothetical protein [Lachnospiraceae bacterium]
MKEKKATKGKKALIKVCIVIAAVALLAVGLFVLYKTCFDPFRGRVKNWVYSKNLDEKLTSEEITEDLDDLIKRLRARHPAWLEDGNEKVTAVEAQYKDEIAKLSGMTEASVLYEWQAASRILNKLGDGHTVVYGELETPLYIDDVTELRQYGIPVRINGEECSAVLDRFLRLFQYEMKERAELIFAQNVSANKAYLEYCGVDVSDGVTYTYLVDGEEKDVHYSFVPVNEIKGYSPSSNNRSFVNYEIDKDRKVGIFELDECNYNDEYRKTLKAFFEEVSANGIESVIVDLRDNGGGNSAVADEFIHYLDADKYYRLPMDIRYGNLLIKFKNKLIKNKKLEPRFSGDVYILTSTNTFSAAKDFTMLVKDSGLGTVVGEPSGNLPDSYGDSINFMLPNSRLYYSMSFKRWFRIDETKRGLPLEADVPCKESEALDVALELIENKRNGK